MSAPPRPSSGSIVRQTIPPEERRLLSSFRLKTVLTVFIVCLLAAVTGLTFLLVTRIFGRFDAAVRSDLEWKALRGAAELSQTVDLGMALGDGTMVERAFGDYRKSPDVLAIVAVGTAGERIAHFGTALDERDTRRAFAARPASIVATAGYVSSWAEARIEGKVVGRVAVLISLRRLHESDELRRLILMLTGAGCVLALFISLFFVNFYLGPLLRFTEATLRNLKNLNATLEERVEERTTELRHSLETLRTTQRQLSDASRRAGMAEVATTVLHNVGNVLNSVNVSCNLVIDRVRQSKVANIARLAELLRDNQATLGPFFTDHPKGRNFIEYLATTGDAAVGHRTAILGELESVQRNVDHIKTIVSHQQTHAKTIVGSNEIVSIADLLDEAIQINSVSFDRHAVSVVRQYEDLPAVKVDRHKLLQIAMNLLSNARHALKAVDRPGPRTITVRVAHAGADRVRVEVEDDGCGIAPENLARVFTYGFTTKPDGHGFGLHSAGCAALEMGGRLAAHSDGVGRGARFTLDLPLVGPDVEQGTAAA